MKIAFHTLGCKVNQFETQALELILAQRGHSITGELSEADVIVVNTCTVTSVSDQKSRRTIRHFAKLYPNARIAVCGCLAQINPDSIKSIDGVSLIAGTSDRIAFVDKIEVINSVNEYNFTPDNALRRKVFEDLPAGGLYGHTRAMLKIEDGCSNFCTYCIIPYSRGPVRSMSPAKALAECSKLRAQGYKEIVVTGIEISSYGKDLEPKTNLIDIISTLCEAFGDIRFRLGSIEPRTITEEFCVKLKSFTNLCPHFHLSLQSGCDETLKRMNRKYDSERFFESVTLLREHFPGCAITTDVIVGFPGETEEEFSQTLRFIEKCRFSSMHIFPYSKRNGTPAAKMSDQIMRAEKTTRSRRAINIAKNMEAEFLSMHKDSEQDVLFEEMNDGYWTGHTPNYIRVYVDSRDITKNDILRVRICEPFKDGVLGEIL
ncbi:MAG: tRNA (N(6)-L-threonylcarbamoyladenosine(37)-C(2))-methylthiotransferase MtaB [Oscillospiraceae bacterium]|nr:tRNA (N(6)-L-threonylcarbamoyladenosine(37)-C(2))-methylthiotransferase MtaB [Oscillospiraceae bacterium]